MSKSNPVPMLVTYRAKKGKEKELGALVAKHLPTLDRLGLITKEPMQVLKATNIRSGEVMFAELFQWRDEEASGIAHQTPDVMAMWEPMGAVMEELTLLQIEPLTA